MYHSSFYLDEDCVTNEQFSEFVKQTNYSSEAELFGFVSSSNNKFAANDWLSLVLFCIDRWSFVLSFEASEDVIDEVDGPQGYGRVKSVQLVMIYFRSF
jgi:formylglycine-generating enzyme required for sulfatase activity